MGNFQASRYSNRISLPLFNNQKQIQSLLSQNSNIATALQMSIWNFNNGKINNKQLKFVLKNVSQTAVRDLNLEANNQKYIMKNFISVKFTNLIVLNLNGNAIQSIQDLKCFDCPKLQILKLEWNYINSIKPLIKCSFKRLTLLFLNQNLITQSSKVLQKSNFSRLNQLRIEQNWKEQIYSKNYSPKIEDILQKMVKFKSIQQHLYLLKIQRKNRINSQKVIKMLKKQFKNLSVVRYFQEKESKICKNSKIKQLSKDSKEKIVSEILYQLKKQQAILQDYEYSDEDADMLDQSKS